MAENNDFLSVSEFAKKYGKDPGNIRKLIQQDRIPAHKIGNQWVIPASVEPPPDKRVKSGRYKGWRKKTELTENQKPED